MINVKWKTQNKKSVHGRNRIKLLMRELGEEEKEAANRPIKPKNDINKKEKQGYRREALSLDISPAVIHTHTQEDAFKGNVHSFLRM